MTESAPQDPRPIAVLDTNAVLDWLLFADPAMQDLGEALRLRQVRWLATPAMREELAHVLSRPELAARGAARPGPLLTWDVLAETRAPPRAQGLLCSDRSDQGFIDLALAQGARWLVTRDKALLKLSRKAAIAGTHILEPRRWRAAAL